MPLAQNTLRASSISSVVSVPPLLFDFSVRVIVDQCVYKLLIEDELLLVDIELIVTSFKEKI